MWCVILVSVFLTATQIIASEKSNSTTIGKAEIRCGRSLINSRKKVLGGEPVVLGAWPWMAALYAKNNKTGRTWYICGGSLIAPEWVLTAAHCIPDSPSSLSHVRLGDFNLNKTVPDNATPVEIQIKKVIKHAQYQKKPIHNDIALLRLSTPVIYTDYIRTICLHTDKKYLNDTFYDPKRPFIAGWDVTQFFGDQSMLEAEIDVIPPHACKENYDRFIKGGEIRIDEKVICANAPSKDTCTGDSGGPLMFREPDFTIGGTTWYQGGIVSVGFQCGREEFPGVYTKVAAFASWIRENTGLKNL